MSASSRSGPVRYAFRHRHTVAWGDMDALGHVNNVAYGRYFEIVRAEFFRSLALQFRADNDQREMLVMSALELRYRKQVVWPAILELSLAPLELNSRTMALACSMWDEADDCVCEGVSRHIWVDRHTGRPTRAPKAFEQIAAQLSARFAPPL